MTPVREALKPCPFCGGQPKIHTYRTSEDSEGAHVECSKCGARTEATDDAYADTITAASMWNTRASAAPGEPCAVKPLEWGPYPNPAFAGPDIAVASLDILGGHHYQVQRNPNARGYMAYLAPDFDTLFWKSEGHENVEAAKAAAQADYEQRIRSALVTTPQPAAGWTCLARKQSLPEPAECNWPDCGCDPHATKVIESLVEQGWTAPREAPAPAEAVTVELEPWRDELSEIVGHLGAAIVQSCAKDDQIIMDHVKAAHEIAKIVRRKA